MNKMRLIIGLAIISLTYSCQENASNRVNEDNVESSRLATLESQKGAPIMSFEKEKHDFGELVEGDVVETVFKFKNTGETPLIITNARASCGCTIPEKPEKPIMPGEDAEIKVKFNSRGKHGKQNKRITLTTNTETGKEYLSVLCNVSKK